MLVESALGRRILVSVLHILKDYLLDEFFSLGDKKKSQRVWD